MPPPFNQGYPPMGPGGQYQYGAPNKFGGYPPYMGGYPPQGYPPMYNAYGMPPPPQGNRGVPAPQAPPGAGGPPPSRGPQAGRGGITAPTSQMPTKETPIANTQQQRQTPSVGAAVTTQVSQ